MIKKNQIIPITVFFAIVAVIILNSYTGAPIVGEMTGRKECLTDDDCRSVENRYCEGDILYIEDANFKCDPLKYCIKSGVGGGIIDCSETGKICEDGACVSEGAECTDTDGGIDYWVRGTVKGLEAPGIWDTWTDYCGVAGEEEGKLVEYICKPDNYGQKVLYSCSNGCSDGACINTIEPTCTDSDGGIDYYVKGTVKNDFYDSIDTDYCDDTEHVNEYYCEEGGTHTMVSWYSCLNGCYNGACIREVPVECYSNEDCPPPKEKRYCDGNDACFELIEYICQNGTCTVDPTSVVECEICRYGCQDGACIETPPEEPLIVPLYSGWNLAGIVGSDDANCPTTEEREHLLEYLWVYDKENKVYIRPNSDDPAEASRAEAILKSGPVAFWTHSLSDECSFGWRVEYKLIDIHLTPGWNFVTITPDMVDLSLNDMKGSCVIEEAYRWYAQPQSWSKPITLDETLVGLEGRGYGMIIKVPEKCSFAKYVPPPPPIPP